MTITLYKSNADPRALDKITSATQIGTAITVKPTEKVNLINPVFEVDYNDTYRLGQCQYQQHFLLQALKQ